MVDCSAQADSEGIGPKDVKRDIAEFGAKVGMGRLFDLFEKYEMKATFAVPGVLGELNPAGVREIIKRGHEVAAHGYKHEDVSKLAVEEEKRRLELTTQILGEISGNKPAFRVSVIAITVKGMGGVVSNKQKVPAK